MLKFVYFLALLAFVRAQDPADLCYEPYACSDASNVISSAQICNSDNCYDFCVNTNNCSYFEFDFQRELCTLYSDCATVTPCQYCDFGSVACPPIENPQNIFVATGTTIPMLLGPQGMDDVEFKSVDAFVSCSTIEPFAKQVYSAAAVRFDGKPAICGGIPHDDRCWVYSAEIAGWESLHQAKMSESKGGLKSVHLNYHHFIVTGGIDGNRNILDTVEFYDETDGFRTIHSLPKPLVDHCAVVIDCDNVFITGGKTPIDPAQPGGAWELNTESWLYHPYSDAYTAIPAVLPRGMYAHTCGVATLNHDTNPTKIVYISGGLDNFGTEFQDTLTIEPLSSTPAFTQGPPLPYTLSYSEVVPLIHDFVLVGGQSFNIAMDTFIRFDVNTLAYTELAQKLTTPRMALAATAVYDEKMEPVCNFTMSAF